MIRTDINDIPKSPVNYHFEPTYSIYSLVNLDNGKRYIGRTICPERRIKQHFSDLKYGIHSNKALNKDRNCRFGYEILEENVSFSKRTDKERNYILLYRTYDARFGYNIKDPCLPKQIRNG